MRSKLFSAAIVCSLCFMCACQSKQSETASPQPSEPQNHTEQAADTNTPQTPAATEKKVTTSPERPQTAGVSGQHKGTASAPKSTPTTPQTSTTAQSGTAASGSAPSKSVKAPSQPIILTGAPMGGVRFDHSKHPVACETCHHPPRDPKRGTTPIEACTTCHTKPPQPGMTTGKQAAFHNPSATAGTCIDCHKKSGGAAPTKCIQCHKKENA